MTINGIWVAAGALQLPAVLEVLCVADGCRNRTRRYWADTRKLRQFLALGILLVPRLNLAFQIPDLTTQVLEMSKRPPMTVFRAWGISPRVAPTIFRWWGSL